MPDDDVRPGQRVRVLGMGDRPLVGTVHSIDDGRGVVVVDLDPPFPCPRVVAQRARVQAIAPLPAAPGRASVDPGEREARRLAFARWLVASGRLRG
jgi:hypothetical protein